MVMKAQSFHATLVHSLEDAHLEGVSDSTVAWYTAPSLGGLPGLRAAFHPHTLPPTPVPTPAPVVSNSGLAGLTAAALAILVLALARRKWPVPSAPGYSDIGSAPSSASASPKDEFEMDKPAEATSSAGVAERDGAAAGGGAKRWTERRYRAFEARRLEGVTLDNDVI